MPSVHGGGVVRLPNTSGVGKVRSDSGYLWSAYLLPTALTKQDYDTFVVGQGSEGQGWGSGNPLSVRETNLPNSGRIPDQLSFVATDLGVYLDGDSVSTTTARTAIQLGDMLAVAENTTLIYRKTGYERNFGPSVFWPGGFGVVGATTQNAAESWTNGFPSHTARRRLKRPLIFNPGDSFKVSVRADAADYPSAGYTLNAKVAAFVIFYGIRHEEIVQN